MILPLPDTHWLNKKVSLFSGDPFFAGIYLSARKSKDMLTSSEQLYLKV